MHDFESLSSREFERLFKHLALKALITLLALFSLTALSCGKRRPPLPPQERVIQRAEISGFQRGNEVILSWRMPARNAPPGDVLFIDRIDIYRLADPVTAPIGVSEEEFAARSVLIGSIKVEESDFSMRTMNYRDSLQFAGQPVRLRYAIRFVNQAGQKASFSNFLLIEPAARVALAPTSLSTEVSQDAVTLRWQAPAENVDGSTPPNILGYNIYRSPSADVPGTLLNRTPVIDTFYADRNFEFDAQYFYFVRTVSLGTGGEPVESSESNIASIRPVDTFQPSAPAMITIAASPTTISIFFPANPESDVVGYRIYRSSDPEKPLDEWELLTAELLKATTFQDTRVQTGETYFYYITAVDRFGNVSPPSEVVQERVP
jgi:hypothetical protein